jgi:hypothetical protein
LLFSEVDEVRQDYVLGKTVEDDQQHNLANYLLAETR